MYIERSFFERRQNPSPSPHLLQLIVISEFLTDFSTFLRFLSDFTHTVHIYLQEKELSF